MNLRFQVSVLILLIFSFLVFSCGEEKTGEEQKPAESETKAEKKEEPQKVEAVCVWDRGSVRAEPRKKGKYLSALSLGEKVSWLKETSVDSNDRNKLYYKIELSDGTVGWSSEYVLAVNARPAISVDVIPIYKRPDLLTMKESSFDKMEFIAVLKSEGKWLEVVGKEKKKSGWINSEKLSYKDEDVAVGLLANKALALEDSEKMKEQIEAIINNPAFRGSTFIGDLKEMLEKKAEKVLSTY
jgi:hypothetical protein